MTYRWRPYAEIALDPRKPWRDPGVYLFASTPAGPPRYAGRSDVDLSGRMENRTYEFVDPRKTMTRRKYEFYWFRRCSSALAAYKWECRLFHTHFFSLDNKRHPAVPKGETARTSTGGQATREAFPCCEFMLDPELPGDMETPSPNAEWDVIARFALRFGTFERIGVRDNREKFANASRKRFTTDKRVPSRVTELAVCLHQEYRRLQAKFDTVRGVRETDWIYARALVAGVAARYPRPGHSPPGLDTHQSTLRASIGIAAGVDKTGSAQDRRMSRRLQAALGRW